MSGPKSYETTVVSPAELQRREDESRRAKCRELNRRLDDLLARLEHPETNTLTSPRTNTHGGLIAWEETIKKKIAATERKLEQERKAREISAIRSRCAPISAKIAKVGAELGGSFVLPVEPSGNNLQAFRSWEASLNTKLAEVEQLLRNIVALRGRCAEIIDELEQMIPELDGPTVSIPAAPTGTEFKKYSDWESALNRLAEKVRPRYYKDHAKKVIARQREGRAALDLSGITFDLAPAAPPVAPACDDRARQRLTAEINRVLEIVGTIDDDGTREELSASARAILASEDLAQARGDLMTLKDRANTVLTVQALRREAADAILAIAQYETPEADLLRARAASIATDEDLRSLTKDIEALCAEENRKADAAFIQQALEEALAELGFDLGEGFNLTEYGTVAYAKHEDYADHLIRMQFNPKNGKMFSRVVSLGDTDAEEDAAVEEASCEKVHAIAEKMGELGVDVNLVHEVQPGGAPVEHVERYGVFSAPAQQQYQQNTVFRAPIERSI